MTPTSVDSSGQLITAFISIATAVASAAITLFSQIFAGVITGFSNLLQAGVLTIFV